MKVTSKKLSTTEYEITYAVEAEALALSKKHAISKLSKGVKIAGFRPGKAPAAMIEKSIDQMALQSEFINEALNHSLSEALEEAKLRPLTQPDVELVKFVAYDTVEFKAKVLVLGPITLPDYKKLNIKKPEIKITEKDIDQVIENLKRHMAEKMDVDRAAKDKDQVWFDFEGKDEKGELVKGASGKDYPIIIGSNTFIPGFEDNLKGLKAEDEKTFTLTFPKDYGVKALQNRKVSFTCKVNKVQEVVEPEVNDALAKKANPSLSTVVDLKDDIKKQLTVERTRQAEQEFDNAIVDAVVKGTKVEIPKIIIDQQIEGVMQDLTQNLLYRGITYQEFLENEGISEDEHREKELVPEARRRVIAGISLSEIADKENVQITPEELEMRLRILKGQYASDVNMQNQLETPEGRRNVAGKLLTEKTIAKLKTYA